ncbi:MAG: Slp family lipoprotein [Acidithiobacillus sp.]
MSKIRLSLWTTLISVAALSGCATVTPVSGSFPDISPLAAQSGNYNGQQVRWGGKLIETHPEAQETCFTVLGEPLNSAGRPISDNDEAHIGRFVACAPGFYDPMLYRADRKVTFIGLIDGIVHHKVGQFNYTYPKLNANVVYLWPVEPIRSQIDEQLYVGPSFGYYPGWWYGPSWGYWPRWRR